MVLRPGLPWPRPPGAQAPSGAGLRARPPPQHVPGAWSAWWVLAPSCPGHGASSRGSEVPWQLDRLATLLFRAAGQPVPCPGHGRPGAVHSD